MGPKIPAACTFAELTGDTAYIGALQDAPEILQDKAGTRSRDAG
jgi:carbamate kinase